VSVRIAGGVFRGRVLTGPPRTRPAKGLPTSELARPTAVRLRKSLFTVLADELAGARVLDLCAGVGTLGFEAISRGARQCVFVERSPRMARLIERNASRLGTSDCELVVGDALRELERFRDARATFDVAFLDPPWDLWESRQGLVMLLEAIGVAPLVVAEHRSSWEPPLRVVPDRGLESEPAASPLSGLRIRTTTAGDSAFSLFRRDEGGEEERTRT
jgi:16S rRNA (guanine966-N2)-methyltransferase